MKKILKVLTIIIAALSAVVAVKVAIDHCRKKYRRTYIKV